LFYNNIYYIIVLDMFRAIPCSFSGSQIVLLQHLVPSLSVPQLRVDCSPLSTGALNGCLRIVKIPDVVTIQFDLLKISMVLLETCRVLLCNTYYSRINKLCIKLVIEKKSTVWCTVRKTLNYTDWGFSIRYVEEHTLTWKV
jgi:hypothetical protein